MIGSRRGGDSAPVFHGICAATGEPLDPPARPAITTWKTRPAWLRRPSLRPARFPEEFNAEFLSRIASGLEAVDSQLVERVMLETALPEPRVRGELARTCFQLRFFAQIVEEGSWVDARMDTKPKIRSMLRPLVRTVLIAGPL